MASARPWPTTHQAKDNPSEHCLFIEISKNWAGRPLLSWELILNYIATTTTKSGLSVTSHMLDADYPAGVKITDQEMADLRLTTRQHLPKWKGTIFEVPKWADDACAYRWPLGL